MTLALYVIGGNVIGFVTFWAWAGMFAVLDFSQPAWAMRYKVQKDGLKDFTLKKFVSSAKTVLVNQIVVGTLFSLAMFPLLSSRLQSPKSPLPGLQEVAWNFVIFAVVEEVFFYYSHRALHSPRLYRAIHKQHHEWKAPVSLSAEYAHPVEHVLSNLLPVVMGPVVAGSHPAVAALWIVFAVSTTCITHSGYHLPLLPSPQAHDWHHLKFKENFGIGLGLDWLHGTDSTFRAVVAGERHRILYDATPMDVHVPGDASQPRAAATKAA